MIDKKLDAILEKISGLDDKVSGLDKNVSNLPTWEELGFRFSQIPTRDEVVQIVENVVSASENRLLTHIDGFITLNQKLDQEVTFLRNKCELLEERLATLETLVKRAK